MTRTLVASMRRMNRMMQPAKPTKATRSLQKSINGFAVASALAPLVALAPKKTTPGKPAASKASRRLGAVVKKLRAVQSFVPRPGAGKAERGPAPRIPEGAQYLTRKHRSATGSRLYKLYLPASAPDRPTGLILMLHGCEQTPDDFAVGTHMNTLAEKHGLAVAYPAQHKGHNAASCWNWFKPGDQKRGAGEPAMLAALARKLMREFGLKQDTTFVAGLSAGGSMAAILADVYPDVFSAAGIHSGLARGSARDMMSAMSAMRRGGTPEGILSDAGKPMPGRRIVFQGDADATVNPSNAPLIVAAAVGDDAVPVKVGRRSVRGRGYARSDYAGPDGVVRLELWMLEGTGHAWSGGRAEGSYTDRNGPDASAQMIRFFLAPGA